MKRALSLLIGMIVFFVTSAQDVSIGSYQDGNGSHKVVVRLKDGGRKIDCVFVYVASTLGEGYFRIDKNKIPEFVAAVSTVKSKFEEWSISAKENGVRSFNKQMEADFPKITAYLSGRPNFNFSQKPKALFQVENDNPCVWIYVNTTTNFTRYSSKKEVFSIVFEKSIDVNSLLSLLNNEQTILRLAQDELQNERKVNNLFSIKVDMI